MPTFPPVSVYFKKVMTLETKTYLVYPDWTISHFHLAIRPLIMIDFETSEDFELVETGQEEGEYGLATDLVSDIQLHEIYEIRGSTLCVGFYIR